MNGRAPTGKFLAACHEDIEVETAAQYDGDGIMCNEERWVEEMRIFEGCHGP